MISANAPLYCLYKIYSVTHRPDDDYPLFVSTLHTYVFSCNLAHALSLITVICKSYAYCSSVKTLTNTKRIGDSVPLRIRFVTEYLMWIKKCVGQKVCLS